MTTSPVARTLGLFTFAALLALLPGCFKMKQTWNVEKSGKGTAVMKVVFDLGKMEELQAMLGEMGGGAADMPDPSKDMDPEEAKKIAKMAKGVRVVSVTTKEDKEKKLVTHDMKVEFDSLQAFFESGLSQGMNVTLKKLEDGNYELKTKMAGAGGMPDMPDTPEMQSQMEMMKAMLEPYMGGLEMSTAMVLPTAIVETNGKKISDTEVQFSATFQNIMKSMQDGQRVVFKGEGLDWKPFSVTPESMEKARKKALEDAKKEAEKAAQPVTPGG